MEISGQYLTYTEYVSMGGTLAVAPFNLLEFEARKRIDERTFNRLHETETIPQEVKLCEFQMINSLNTYSASQINKNVASETTDGYSVTYVGGTQMAELVKSKSAELDDIIRTYLTGVIVNDEHVLYLGIQ